MKTLRVLVVEDSLTVRKRIVEVLSRDPDIEVVGEAADGQRAIELVDALRPDVITLDMMLPVMNGLAATEHIMAYRPTPIIIVSASFNRGEMFSTYDALAAGAVEVLDKPTGHERDDAWERKLIVTVKLAARIKVITHPRARLHRAKPTPEAPAPTPAPRAPGGYQLLAIGASTGGPQAIVQVLRGLPRGFPLPVLFVIHIGRPFGDAFAEWLDGRSPIRVAYAHDGESLPRRGEVKVLMAPPDRHLAVRKGLLRLTDDPERHSCRPSVDVLFESVARELGSRAIGCLLTGMGKDGAEGLRAMRRAGAMTIAQDEASSVVFGMPREAIQLGAAQQVLALDEIAATLGNLAHLHEGAGR